MVRSIFAASELLARHRDDAAAPKPRAHGSGWPRRLARAAIGVVAAFAALPGMGHLAYAQLGGFLPIPIDREWYHEDEFTRTPGLRAEPRHVVVLDFKRSAVRGSAIVHSIPYRLLRDRTFDFCVPKDDPNIRSITLMAEGSPPVIVKVPRGAPCKTKTVSAGLYRLQIEQDGQRAPASGATGFVHVPRSKRIASGGLQSAGTVLFDPTYCQGLPADAAQSRPRYVFRTPSGRWIYSQNDFYGTLHATAIPSVNTQIPLDLAVGGFTSCRFGSGETTFAIHKANGEGYLTIGTANQVPFAPIGFFSPTPYDIVDLGNFQFALYHGGYPIFEGDDLALHWAIPADNRDGFAPASAPTPLSNPITYYPPGTPVPDLLPGEVALMKGSGFNTSQGTWVIRGDLPDTSSIAYTNPFTGQRLTIPPLGGVDNSCDSVRLGPRTVLQTFRRTFYYLPLSDLGQDQSCVWFAAETASLQIVSAEQWIASTNACNRCNLSGIDLSGEDLSSGSFNASTFVGANLTNTIFRDANVSYSDFSGADTRLDGTDFSGAGLIVGDLFRGSDVSKTNLRLRLGDGENYLDSYPDLLDFHGATVSVQTLYPKFWRLQDFTGAVFVDSKGADVSSTSDPIDLSSAKMSNVFLPGIGLAGANVSGADFTGANLSGASLESAYATDPATFNLANLTRATLKNGRFSKSFFRGTALSPANLAGADLSGAWFEDDGSSSFGRSSLAGSYMLDTRLNDAHLTNAVLDQVSWYNVDPATPIATGAGAFMAGASFNLADLPGLDLTGATLQGAALTNAQLIGANLTNARLDPNGATATNASKANFGGANLNNTNLSSANLFDAGVSTTQDPQVFIEVLKDPDRFQKPPQYQFFAVNRPPTAGTPNTSHATCPSGLTASSSGCGPIASGNPNWVAPNPPLEPTDCQPSEYDSQGNVIAITCQSGRHPAGG
jgi:uncharacterized protein YjbI with pentapeptide repeats